MTSAAPTGVGLLDLAGCCSGAQCWIASALFPTALSVWLLGFASHDTDPLTAGYGVLNFGGPLFAYVGNAVFPWDGGAAPAAADGDTITVLLCGDDITLEINGAPAATATGVGLPAGVDHLALVADTTPAFYDLAVSCGL